jgi:hypothetical protein
MNRIRIQVGLDKPVNLTCASRTEAIQRAERLVELFRLAGNDRPLLPVRGSARSGRWTVEGLHDPITVTVEKAQRHA